MTTLPLSRTLITLAISQLLLACAPLKPQFVSHFSTDPNQPPGSTAPMARVRENTRTLWAARTTPLSRKESCVTSPVGAAR